MGLTIAASGAAQLEDFRPLLDFGDPEGTEARLTALLPRAQAYFRSAYEALSDDVWMVNTQAERLARLRQLGEVD